MGVARMRLLILVGLALAAVSCAAAAAPAGEDPMDEANDMLKHLGMAATQSTDLGESNDQGVIGPVDIGEATGAQSLSKSKQEPEKDETDSKADSEKSQCVDHEGPEICNHKNILCDDEAHRDTVRFKCAQTCGVCRELAANGNCRDATRECSAQRKYCSNSNVKALCKQTCGECEGTGGPDVSKV